MINIRKLSTSAIKTQIQSIFGSWTHPCVVSSSFVLFWHLTAIFVFLLALHYQAFIFLARRRNNSSLWIAMFLMRKLDCRCCCCCCYWWWDVVAEIILEIYKRNILRIEFPFNINPCGSFLLSNHTECTYVHSHPFPVPLHITQIRNELMAKFPFGAKTKNNLN